MPIDPKTGVETPATPPVADPGVTNPVPPTETVPVVEDGNVDTSQWSNEDRAGLLKALQDERRKRQEAEAGNPQPPARSENYVDWDNSFLQQPANQNQQQQQQAVPEVGGFMDWVEEALDSGDKQAKFNAISAVFGVMREQEKLQENEARSVVPNIDDLPLHTIPPELRARVMQNPKLLDALIIQAHKATQPGNPAPQPQTHPTVPNQGVEQNPPQVPPSKPVDPNQSEFEKMKAGFIEEGVRRERSRIQQGDVSGMTSESSASGGTPPTNTEQHTFEPGANNYLSQRGYNAEQIAVFAAKVKEKQDTDQYGGF